MVSTLVIYNPTAGRKRVKSIWPKFAAALWEAGVEFDAVATAAPLDAIRLARSLSNKYSRVVGVGGDGTMSEIVNGLMQASREAETLPFAIVPLGNGDDFAKVLTPGAGPGSKSYDWQEAVVRIARGTSKLYDVGRLSTQQAHAGRANCHYFLNVVDIGFGAHTVKNFATIPKFLSGYPAYLAAALKTILNYPALRVQMQIDDAPWFTQSTTMTAIGNGRCFGGGVWVCPQAQADDGLFDVMIANQISRRGILSLIPKFERGTHIDHPAISMHRARRVVMESEQAFLVEADGEMPIPATRRLEVEVVPGKLRLIV